MADFFPNRFGGAPRIGPGGGRALRRAGLPHLQAPKPPQINYGAVAQARTRPPAPAPLQSPFGRSMGPGLGTLAPTVRQNLPEPKTIRLTSNEKQAKNIISQGVGYMQGTPKAYNKASVRVKSLIQNPSPNLAFHINTDPFLKLQHQSMVQTINQQESPLNIALQQAAKHPYAGMKPSEAIDAYTQANMPQPETSGFGFVPGLSTSTGAGGYLNRLGTGVAHDAIGAGVGLEHLPGALYRHPLGTPEMMGKSMLSSLYATGRHPIRMFWDQPDQGLMNALTIGSLGAGGFARGAEALNTVRAGELSGGALAKSLGKTALRPQPVERSIQIGPDDVHFNRQGLDPQGHTKTEFQLPSADVIKKSPYLGRMPIYLKTHDPENAIIGAPGESHADLEARPGGGTHSTHAQASAIIDPESGRVVKINFHDKRLEQFPGKQKAVQRILTQKANEKLVEAHNEPLTINPPAFKGALGGRIQKHLLDPLTERAIRREQHVLSAKTEPMIRGASRELRLTNQLTGMGYAGKAGKLTRRDVEMATNIRRGIEEVRIAKQFGLKGPYDKEEPIVTHPTEGRMLGENHPTTGTPMTFYKRPTPADIEKEPWLSHWSGFYNPKTRQVINGHVGSAHADVSEAEQIYNEFEHGGEELYHAPWHQFTGIFDPDTGEPAAINFHGNEDIPEPPPGSIKGLTHQPGVDLGHEHQMRVLDQAKKDFWTPELKSLPQRTAEMSTKQRKALAAEAQRRAFAIGSAKTHVDTWHQLYHGGQGSDVALKGAVTEAEKRGAMEHWVGIKKPPASINKWKKYAGDANIARQWQDMVEKDPAKLAAEPDDYSYIPKAMWQRMQITGPDQGHLARAMNVMDSVTQAVRAGRFLHPGYLAWAVQNGILHASQAGAFAFRNAYKIRKEFPKMTPEQKAMFDNAVGAGHFGGGIARAYEGKYALARMERYNERASFRSSTTQKLAHFWHNVDDRYWRRMSLAHELIHAGYKNADEWSNLMKTNPQRFRTIGRRAQQEAIDYSEMGPGERQTLAKLFTAWGWTRGASTYTMRFPFQHPAQAAVGMELAREGNKRVKEYYAGHNGMVPSWLEGYAPYGGGKLFETGILNPVETLGSLMESLPGLTKGQTESLGSELSPAFGLGLELLTGQSRYGQAYRGGERVSKPISEMLGRFAPLAALHTFMTSKKGGGTMEQGPMEGLKQFFGIPTTKLLDPNKTAALGMKDYEQALSMPDEIKFRHDYTLQQLPHQLQAYAKKSGSPLPGNTLSALKHDIDAVEMRDLYMAQYAHAHGANSFKSLPAMNRAQAGIAFMLQHKYVTPSQAQQWTEGLKQRGLTESDLTTAANDIWSTPGIGSAVNEWKKMVKEMQPTPALAARP